MLTAKQGAPVPDNHNLLQQADKAIWEHMVGDLTKADEGFEDRVARALKLLTPGSRFLYHSNI
jgi:hypothetical protein